MKNVLKYPFIPILCYENFNNSFKGNKVFYQTFPSKDIQNKIFEFISSDFDEHLNAPYNFMHFSSEDNEYIIFSIKRILSDSESLILFIDTEDMKSLLSKLKYSKDKDSIFYKFFDSLYDDFTVINKNGIIENVWSNFESVYGIPNDQIIGSSIYDMEAKGIFNPCVSAMVMRSLRPETMLQVTKDNKYLMCTSIPIFNDKNELDKIISYTRNANQYRKLTSEYENLQNTMSHYVLELGGYNKESSKNTKIIGDSKAIKSVISTAIKVAQFDATAMISGESGVGKNMLAELIHSKSMRSDAPFVSINCGAIPENLLESELFGYEKGAFTGANQTGKKGIIELADKGILFLDEICDLPLHMQVKLLKVIQERKITRIGGIREKDVNFRLITATNKNIRDMVNKGLFREDLFYRLNVISIKIPPLRERQEDIFPLVRYFSEKFNKKYDVEHVFTNRAISFMENYSWPGNVRELENIVERTIITADEFSIKEDNLPYYIYSVANQYDDNNKQKTLKQILENTEKHVLLSAYEKYGSTTKVAKELGISQPSVSLKLKKYMK